MLVALAGELAEAPALYSSELPLERALRGELHVQVERGVDSETLFVKLPPELCVELLTNPFDEIRRRVTCVGLARELKGVCARFPCLHVGDGAISPHQLDDRVAPLNRALRMTLRVVALGCLWKSRESRRFGDVQVANRFTEVPL